ncbi:RNA-directed DNA polymerase from mobile element jockey [Eumeta japonica]|uniref:RNA-directed DNA polymerase from mobile element jockey n=1 Tax=Eumeta variegata TaxID=151549 RepID=A0A4C1ULS8_EUMVA|nr:RNA-directed DNA polymerase from mobile element jockey [Eumeta japonica]
MSFNARGLESNITELGKCAEEYSVDIILVQETYLKPKIPKTCKIPSYVQIRKDRLSGRLGGTAVYYRRSLHSCPFEVPSLINLEVSACRLAVTGHGTLIIVSVYLPSRKKLLRSDIEALLALGDAVILFDDFNYKNKDWNCKTTNKNRRKLACLTNNHDFAIVTPLTPTHYPDNVTHRPDVF